jgi:hypothetical protein
VDNKVLAGKLLLGVTGALLCVAGTRPGIQRLPWRRYVALTYGYLLLSRVLVFGVLYMALGLRAQSDVPGIYYPQAKHAIHGLLPYRDFRTDYAPLFPYIASIPVRIVHSPLGIIVLAILFEFAAYPVWVALARRVASMEAARLAMLCYVTSPIALVNVAIDGQNQVWLCVFLAAALLLFVSRRQLAAGAALSISIVAVKFLSVLLVPAFLISGSGRRRFLAGLVALPAVVYGLFLLLGADVLRPIGQEASDHTSGNLPFLLSILFHPNSPPASHVVDIATAVFMVGVYLLAYWKLRTRDGPALESFLVVLFMLTLMIFSKKAYTNYLVIFLFPLCLVIAVGGMDVRRIWTFGLLGILATLEPSLWFRWLGQRDLLAALDASPGATGTAKIAIFAAWDLVLVGLYAYYWWGAWRLLTATRRYGLETQNSPLHATIEVVV